MQRSSETIGAIAAALAKAQAELTNPEKSLVATIRGRDSREGERSFRYAPLSSGLEIVRKALGQHEIATIQRTEIDKEAGLIHLTTVLAHSSGEWMSSDWPVCAIAEANAPQRMGAALTYARRYALFTLVGIAGEDDLDAPDLAITPRSGASPEGAAGTSAPWPSARSGSEPAQALPHKRAPTPPKPILAPEGSATCRDQLVSEIGAAATADDMGLIAYRVLPLKNTLRAEDAAIVEQVFAAKLKALATDLKQGFATDKDRGGKTDLAPRADAPTLERRALSETPAVEAHPNPPAPNSQLTNGANTSSADVACAELAFGKTRRKRNKAHCAFVASKPCLVCGRRPADAHHLCFAQPRALGRKSSDEFTVPLCRIHHRDLHLRGDEVAWWQELGIDALAVALGLWRESRGTQAPMAAPPTR